MTGKHTRVTTSLGSTYLATRISFGVSQPWGLHSRPTIELTIGYALILSVIWTPNPIQGVLFWVSFAFIVGTALASRRLYNDDLGFGFRRIRQALWIVAAVLAGCLVVIGIAEATHILHPLFGPKSLPMHVWGYLIWALLQQFILQDFFLLRLLRITGGPLPAILSAGFLFAVAHLPNPVLTLATLLWGIAACVIFLRYRSLYVLGVAHWMLGLCIAVCVPNNLNRHMRVGLGYLRYHAETEALDSSSEVSTIGKARHQPPSVPTATLHGTNQH